EGGGSAIVPNFNGSNYVVPATGNFQAISPGDSQPTAAKHFAVTRHRVLQASNNQLLTISLVDGLGQAIQLKKTQFVNNTGVNQLGWLISGKEEKDTFGRVIKAYLPTFTTTYYPSNPNSLDP